MNQELTIVPSTSPTTVPTSGDNFELSASNPKEMVQCHHAAIAWAKRKIEVVKGEAKELKDAYEKAVKSKWSNGTLKRHAELALKRVTFYEKMLAAFEHGYYIVPNFPVTLFAIRTDKEKPKRMWARLRWEGGKNFQQNPEILPQGEGEYKNPNPVITKDCQSCVEDDGRDTWVFEATDWDEMEFPANMARLHVMEAATKAMDAKIFDEVGFLPVDHKRNPDPLLIGRIIEKGKSPYKSDWKVVSFIIAWHIDTKTL